MDSRQAKEILALYRPGIDDAADPFFAEAIDQARREPELGRWLQQYQRVDAALRQKFKQIAVPAGTRTTLRRRTEARPATTDDAGQPGQHERTAGA